MKGCHGLYDAYFCAFDARRDHGYDECHECYGFQEYNGGSRFLCRGKLGNLDFKKIERIIDIKKEAGTLKYQHIAEMRQIIFL